MLHYVGLGAANKEIAFTLGLSLSTVSGALTQLLRKLRCESRVDLAHFADPTRLERVDAELLEGDVGVLSVDVRPSGPAMVTLSAAEREIAGYVSRGYSNERIARARGAAVRTVANQIQSIYGKLGVSSRSELRAALRSA